MLFFEAVLNPLAALSCHLQGTSVDLPFALASLESFNVAIQALQADDPEKPTELSKFVEDTQRGSRPHFREVKLSGTESSVLKHFNDSRPNYIEAILKCIQGRFCGNVAGRVHADK